MPEKWTGELIGRMHNERINRNEVAEELGVSKAYVTMILNGSRSVPGMRERLEAAVAAIIDRRAQPEKAG